MEADQDNLLAIKAGSFSNSKTVKHSKHGSPHAALSTIKKNMSPNKYLVSPRIMHNSTV